MTFKKSLSTQQYYYHLHLYQQHVAETAKLIQTKQHKQLQHKLQLHKQQHKNLCSFKDGTYKLVSEADKRGWHVEFTINVEGGKITKSDYDNLNDKGERKISNAEYEKQ